jgi:hypothetical protein
MYTIKFKIGDQWRAYPATKYFWGHGMLRQEKTGLFVKYKNSEERMIDVGTVLVKDISKTAQGVGDMYEVFYILRFSDEGTDMMVFDDNFLEHADVFIMENGKTVDRL